MTTLAGKINTTLIPDPTFSGSVTVPANFMGLHNNSIGTNVITPSTVATCSCTLSKGVPVVTMTNTGGGYYNAGHTWCAAIFSGGDGTVQATGYPVIQTNGTITGVNITSPGNYVSVAPTCTIVTKGGPNIPAIPFSFGTVRTHDYMGDGSSKNTKWYGIDPADGSGNYNWATLDECVLWHAANGRDVMFTCYGTPANYVATAFTSGGTPLYINSTYDNYLGGSSPLNATGLTVGTPNVGLDGFIKALVTRYNINASSLTNPVTGLPFTSGSRLIKYIEVWNEPQFGAAGAAIAPQNGAYWLGTPQNLVDMARIINLAAKGLDPLIKIIGCGFVSAFPMSISTSQYNHFSNFMTAVDSTQGLPGSHWIDDVSIHPYDSLEHHSRFLVPPNTIDAEIVLQTTAQTIATLGGGNGIIASEWGFENAGTVFQTTANDAVQAAMIKRVYAVHALHGLVASCGYTYDSTFLGFPMQSAVKVKAMQDFAMHVPGKTITSRKNGANGAIWLGFSDGTSWFTG